MYMYVFTSPSDLVAQSVERRRCNPKVVGSIPTMVRVFLCPCVGPFPSVGLNAHMVHMGLKSSTSHYTLFSYLCLKYKCYTANVCINVTFHDITPVHKKDLPEPAENYRPISLLPIVSKVMERCVCNRLYSHVSQSITFLQHGFMRSRSCSSQLLFVLHSIGEALDKNKQTDVLYLDFAKAFDTADHAILIEKLKWYGVTGQLLDWFSDYQKDRSQRVVINGEASVRLPVTSGVPQGILVGPLLFVIFINDLPDAIHEHTSTALYADDTKQHRTILAAKDCDILQQDLTSLNTWSHESNLKFNASKCKVLTVTRRKTPVTHEYHLGEVILQRVQEEKDLGVTISSNLSWNLHVTRIVLKANRMLGLLKIICPLITDIKVRRTLYLSLMKSRLSYATVVWSPDSVDLRTILERVQRRTTRWILRTRIGEMSYKQRLLTLALLPLTYDRELRGLVFLYNCIFGYTDLNIGRYVTFITHGRSRSKNPTLVLKPVYCKTATFQASFFNRKVKPWNFICNLASYDKFSSLSSFKKFLHANYFTYRTLLVILTCPAHGSSHVTALPTVLNFI